MGRTRARAWVRGRKSEWLDAAGAILSHEFALYDEEREAMKDRALDAVLVYRGAQTGQVIVGRA